jgi:hypothetical protein
LKQFLYILVLVSFNSLSSEYYLNYFPAGYEESIMANTGIALDGSIGNMIYNPAGLVNINAKEDSTVSGVIINKRSLSLGEYLEEESSKISTPPAFSSSFKKLTTHSKIGCFAYTPIDLTYKVTNDNTSGFTANISEIIFGVTVSILVTPKFSYGFSLGLANHETSIHSFS